MRAAPTFLVNFRAPVAGLMRSYTRLAGVSWALVDQCVVSAANFGTIYLLARFLEAPIFGSFVLGYTALLLLTGLQGALVTQPHNVLGATLAHDAYRRFTSALVVAQGFLCVAASLMLGASGLLVGRFYSQPAGQVLLALAAAVPPWFGQEFVRRVLYTRGASRSAALNDLVTYGLQVTGVAALTMIWREDATPRAALLVLGGSSLAGVVLGAWQLRDQVRLRGISWRDLTGVWRETWSFGKWLTAQNAISWFGSQGYVWLVGIMLGPGPVGVYRAATHFAHLLNPLRQAAFSYLPPRGSLAYHANGALGLSRWVGRTAIVLLIVLLPPCLLLIGFAGDVLRIAYGARYASRDMALILAAATFAQCLTFWKFPYDIGLLALRATKWIFYVNLVPVPLLLTLGVALVYVLGVAGAPLAAAVINAALFAATWIAYRRRLAADPLPAAAQPSRPS